MPQAFDGVRVLELGQIYNGPYCGLLLAQLGADVIKIEPPGGEQLRFRSHQPTESHEFVMLNSNKRSVVLDLKTDSGRQAARPGRDRRRASDDDKLTEQVLCIFGVIPDEARRICCTPLPDAGRSGEPGSAG